MDLRISRMLVQNDYMILCKSVAKYFPSDRNSNEAAQLPQRLTGSRKVS